MTKEEFKKALETTDDIKSLIENHVTANGYGAIEYDDYIIPFKDDNCYISVTDADHIMVFLRQINNDLSLQDTYDKICVSYKITAKANIDIHDITFGSTRADIYSSNIELCTSSKTINWENFREYVIDLYAVVDEDNSIISKAKDIIGKLLPYNIFYFHNNNRKLNKLYDEIVQYIREEEGNFDEITLKDIEEYFDVYDDLDEYTEDYNCVELLDCIDDLYNEDNKAVDKDELDSLARSIVDTYYDGFSFEEIARDVNLYGLHDENETPNTVTINFSFK